MAEDDVKSEPEVELKFTNDEEIILITFYSEHPELWDSKHDGYSKRTLRTHLMKQLAEKFDGRFKEGMLWLSMCNKTFLNGTFLVCCAVDGIRNLPLLSYL